MKSHLYLDSVEVFYICFKVIAEFVRDRYRYCLCANYQGCQTQSENYNQYQNYCPYCRFYNYCTVKKLNFAKKNPKELINFHEYLLDELPEIKRAQSYVNFWECKLIFKTTEWKPDAENPELYSKRFLFYC